MSLRLIIRDPEGLDDPDEPEGVDDEMSLTRWMMAFANASLALEDTCSAH